MEVNEVNFEGLPLGDKQKYFRFFSQVLARREFCGIEFYEPHDLQVPFHKSKAGIRLLLGANRSGKTTPLLAETVWTATGTHPFIQVEVPNKTWVCATDFPHGVGSVLGPKLKSLLPRESVRNITKNQQGIESRFELTNGSIIEFKSYDQDADKFESADIDNVAFDEPPPRDIFQASMRGLVDRGGKVWFAMTPISEAWIYTDLYLKSFEDKNIEVFKMSIYDNPHLSAEGIRQFETVVKGTDYEKARLYGEFLELQGKVFKPFDRRIHVIEGFWPLAHYPVYMGVDPHPYGRKNQAALWMSITPDDHVVFFDEVWEDLTIEELRNKIIDHDYLNCSSLYNVKARVIDTSINIREALSHQNYKAIIEKPYKGVSLRFKLANKTHLLTGGLEYINTLLKPEKDGPRLYVDARCKRLIQEFELHGWKNSRRPESAGILERELNTYNDMISIVRYIFSINPLVLKNHHYLKLPVNLGTYGGRA